MPQPEQEVLFSQCYAVTNWSMHKWTSIGACDKFQSQARVVTSSGWIPTNLGSFTRNWTLLLLYWEILSEMKERKKKKKKDWNKHMIQNSAGWGWRQGRDRCSYTLPRTFKISYFELQEIGYSHCTLQKPFNKHYRSWNPQDSYQSSSSHRKHKHAFQTLPKPGLHAPCWAVDKKTITNVRGSAEEHACLFNLTREKGGGWMDATTCIAWSINIERATPSWL